MSACTPRPEAAHTPVLIEYVRRLVETWPPLTSEQSERIAVLLRPGGGSQ